MLRLLRVSARAAAILLEIDANELNNVFASRHFVIFKIGKIGNYLGDSRRAKFAFRTLFFSE